MSLAKTPYCSASEFFLNFYAKRIKRILPALIVCVLVTAIVGSLFINPKTSAFKSSMDTGFYALFGFSNIFLYLQSVDYFGFDAHLNFFTHTWSLGVEEQFYFAFPFLFWITGTFWLARNGRLSLLAILTIASFVFFIWQTQTDPSAAYYLVFSRFWELSIGCLIALVLGSSSLNIAWASWFGGLVLAAAFAFGAKHSLYTIPAAVVGTVLIISTVSPRDIFYRFLTLKPMIWIGLISSYSC